MILALRATDPEHRRKRANTEHQRQRRKRLRAAGLCVHCTAASPDTVVYESCSRKSAALQKELHARRRAAGQCIRCGSSAHTTADHYRRIRDAKTAAGKCIGCRERPRFRDRKRCRRCLHADAERQAQRRARNVRVLRSSNET